MVKKVEICVGKGLPLNPAEGLHASLAEDLANTLEMYGGIRKYKIKCSPRNHCLGEVQ